MRTTPRRITPRHKRGRRGSRAARSIGRFLATHQRPDGDLQDGFDESDREVNRKPHRIAARAIACGLWAQLARIDNDPALFERASRLAGFVAPQIRRCEFDNQMIDTQSDGLAAQDFADAEGRRLHPGRPGDALRGDARSRSARLVPSLRRVRAHVDVLLRPADRPPRPPAWRARVPHADYRIVYPGCGAQAVRPLLTLARLTGDPLYRTAAREMLDCACALPVDRSGQAVDRRDRRCDRSDQRQTLGPQPRRPGQQRHDHRDDAERGRDVDEGRSEAKR
jgi:hypothetical protein